MKIKLFFLATLVFLLCGCTDVTKFTNSNTDIIESEIPNEEKDINVEVSQSDILNNLNIISSEVRNFGSVGEIKIANYLKTTLEDYGYNVSFQEFEIYKQTIDSTLVENAEDYFIMNPSNSSALGTGTNIVAKQNNFDINKKTLYLTAHYDTTEDTIGVFDNASGCSVVLEVARLLSAYNDNVNVAIVFFSAEEYYRFGSRYFVSKLSDIEKQNILGCINVDMVGEKEAGDIIMGTVNGKDNILSILLQNSINTSYKLDASGGGGSDDLSFYFGKIPTLTLSNQNSNPLLATTNNQNSYLDLNQLIDTCNNITEFITSINLSTYNNMLNEKGMHDIIANNKFIEPLLGYTCISSGYTLNDNGYNVTDIYEYENNSGSQYTITRTDPRFYSGNYDDFIMIDPLNNIGYKILKSNNENTIKLFYNANYCGEIDGNISLDECLILIEALANFYQ